MKILILGANGMLGHALMKQFANEDIFVGDLPEYDITKFEEIKFKIRSFKPEVVINAAAYTNVDGCEEEKEKCNLVNGEAVGNLARICNELDIILVHFSTDYIFDGQNKLGYRETDLPNPINAYGQSKLLAEKLLIQHLKKYYLIRTAWLYGSNGKNFVNTIIDLSKTKKEIKIVNDQFGNPTYVKDLAEVVHQMIISQAEYGIYHQTNSGSCSWYELAKKIKEIKKLDIEIVPVSSNEYIRPATRPKYSKLVNNKLKEMPPWQEALEDYLKTLK